MLYFKAVVTPLTRWHDFRVSDLRGEFELSKYAIDVICLLFYL